MSLPAAFPSSLDALANPTATTNRDDAGFELDLVVARIHDILEAIEAKLGIGASLPVANSVLVGNGPGTSAYLAGLTSPYLAANAATRLTSAPALATASVTSASLVDLWDLTVVTQGGPLLALVGGSLSNPIASALTIFALKVNALAAVQIATVHQGSVASAQAAFVALYPVPAVAAGTHHLKLQWSVSTNTTTIAVGWYSVLELIR